MMATSALWLRGWLERTAYSHIREIGDEWRSRITSVCVHPEVGLSAA
jgi:hypothetical protein